MLDRGGEAWAGPLAADGFATCTATEAPPAGRWWGCIVDSYDIEPRELAELRRWTGCLVALRDDLRAPPGADLVLNAAPGLSGDRLDGVPALLGAAYVLIGEAFAALPAPEPRQRMQHLLVSFGYMDDHDMCDRTLQALAEVDAAAGRFAVTVAIGSKASHLPALRGHAARHRHAVAVRLDVADMAGLLRESDLAIGAGGVSLYERLASGVPSLTVRTADNQALIVEGAAAAGATVLLGGHETVTAAQIGTAIARLDGDLEIRQRLAARGRRLVDGGGPARAAAAIHAFAANMAGTPQMATPCR